MSKRILELADIYGLKIDPAAYIWQLSVGQQQRVEIIKALYRGAALLILDEPTAVLTPQEVDELFVIMRQMVQDGHALIFISHKLHEVVEISQRVTRAARRPQDGHTPDLGDHQAGPGELDGRPRRGLCPGSAARPTCAKYACSSRTFPARATEAHPALREVSLDVRSGEILGIAGVSGNGQRELAEAITGLRKITSGRIDAGWQGCHRLACGELHRPDAFLHPGGTHARRHDQGIHDRREHDPARASQGALFSRGGFLDLPAIAHYADELISKFHVKTPSRETLAKNLSGGNIQKVVLARELSRHPRAIVAAQPTRGPGHRRDRVRARATAGAAAAGRGHPVDL